MKRSDMIDIIEDYLGAFDSNFHSTFKTAEDILNDIERAGMLPPLLDSAWSDYSENKSSGNHAEEYAIWEPEDDSLPTNGVSE